MQATELEVVHVCMYVCICVRHFEDEMTHDRVYIVRQVDWVLVLTSHCSRVVLLAIASGMVLTCCVIASILPVL